MPNHNEKHFIRIELPETVDLNDIKEAIEDALGFVIKETELDNIINWVVVDPSK